MTEDLTSVLEELKAREPLFHHSKTVYSEEAFDAETDDNFFEIGASGAIYGRPFLRMLALQRPVGSSADDRLDGWRIRQLGPDTYLVTYTLKAKGRVTRRTTIWRKNEEKGWHALFRQGTVVQDN